MINILLGKVIGYIRSHGRIKEFLKSISIKYPALTGGLLKVYKRNIPMEPVRDCSAGKSDEELGIHADKKEDRNRKIYIDISELVRINFVTGIQRVCNALVYNMTDILKDDPEYEVVPVYSDFGEYIFHRCECRDGKYQKSAEDKREDKRENKKEKTEIKETAVDFRPGDYFLMPDADFRDNASRKNFLERLGANGVKAIVLLHDIIPVEYPEFYDKPSVYHFTEFLKTTPVCGGVVAVSRASLDALGSWYAENGITLRKDFIWSNFHLGSDIEMAVPSGLKPGEDLKLIEKLRQKQSFLVVSTIEPRKCHAQILDAFEILWSRGVDVNLVFVGKYGWQMEEFANRILHHERNGKSFFWLQGISDEYLDMVYEASSVVIMASLQEGFGLSIVEAAYHHKPMLLRDIPVFREVAGESARYFTEKDGEGLAKCIEEYMDEYEQGSTTSEEIEILSWRESVRWFMRECGITEE